MHSRITSLFMITVMVAFGMVFLSCESLTDGSEDGDTGTLTVLLTDVPFPADLVAEANVTIDSLVVHAMDSDTFITLSSNRQVFNLLDLRNGVTAGLASLEIPTGRYNQLRLIVDDSAASVILNDSLSTSAPLEIPSGGKSGMKLNIKPFLQIEAGIESELLLDFDVSKSFHTKGNLDSPGGITGFIFSPVLRVVNLANAGRLQGTVTDSSSDTGIAGAQVSISTVDSVLTSTFTDTAGAYAIIGIPADTYSVEAAAAGYNTETASDVAVDARGTTVQNFVLTPQ
ncbi:MAG: DUF4382 domain-containing protein [Candidatus Neomarinimicrobiota bacterium]